MDKRVRKRKTIKKLKSFERQLKKALEPIVLMDVKQFDENNLNVMRQLLGCNEPMSYFEIKAKFKLYGFNENVLT